MKRPWIIPAAIAAFILLCYACLFSLAAVTMLAVWRNQSVSQPQARDFTPVLTPTPRATPLPRTPTPPIRTPSDRPSPLPPTPKPTAATSAPGLSWDTLETLRNTIVPINDPADLARRLEGKGNIPATLAAPPAPLKVGDRQTFWVSNTDTNEYFQVKATLQYVTDHAYFWIEDGVSFKERELRDLAETFEKRIYPTNREFFGSEWTPGVDSDPHLYILYTRRLGNGIAGYFSSADEYPPAIQEYSNAHEMFVLNADSILLNEEFTYGVLAHEFQHMIHWYRDRNEETWLNEGFSDLAMFLNGYDIGGHDFIYVQDPDLQLNDWPTEQEQTTPHYGASFLFTTYFLDRFGEEATKALVAEPDNGLDSIDKVLAELKVTDPLSGEPITADDVVVDWLLASYLQDGTIADGRYTYHNYPHAPRAFETESLRTCSEALQSRQVHQYGADYIQIRCKGDITLHFAGETQVGVLPTDPYSGDYAFWSNKGDESDMTLTRTFDFSNVSAPLTLSYWTWYDLEEDFDYLYLEASLDGKSWQILTTPSGTDADPTGANYGWGYNGSSGGGPRWIQEEVDLSQFAGQKVQLRFEYVTDAAVNGEGFLLDDVAIPQIGYFSDFENDDGGWQAQGFVRIANSLPQTFRLALIRDTGRQISVDPIALGPDNTADIPLNFESALNEAVLVVIGTTRFTRQVANYQLYFTP